jgi:hypothetical protein
MPRKQAATGDRDIRTALRAKLIGLHGEDPGAFIVDELPVDRGGTRMDVTVINGRIEGFEIKSAKDTLERLARQGGMYGGAFDRVTLVADRHHLQEALDMIPCWWGAVAAEMDAKGKVRLRTTRRARPNPCRTADGMIGLLERPEILSLLAFHSLDRGLSGSNWQDLAAVAIEKLSVRKIAVGVRRLLKIRALVEARYDGTSFGSTAAGGGILAGLEPYRLKAC